MEMHLQPLATSCFVSGEPFVEGTRVVSFLVQAASLEILRYDVLETNVPNFTPDGRVACRWVHVYKPRKAGENQDRALKLNAESLFITLADPTTEPTAENTRLLQFLALMLERKKIIKPRGRTADGARNRYEHARSKQMFEVPVGELTSEFFVAVQEQLTILVGAPKPKPAGDKPVGEATAAEKSAGQKGAEESKTDATSAPESAGSGADAPAQEPLAAPPVENRDSAS